MCGVAGDGHQTVLLEEAVDALMVDLSGIYIDATFGRGGHSAAILDRLDAEGRLFALDRDPEAVSWAERECSGDGRFMIQQGSFADLTRYAESWGLRGQVSGVLFDLGVSSPQLDQAPRGFSFQREGPLDMRLDCSTGITAAEWLAPTPEGEIERALRTLGEERYARRVARAIVAHQRNRGPLTTTTELAELVRRAIPRPDAGGRDAATRTFQAIRIAVNGELEALEAELAQAVEVLKGAGRLVVISFHSLEDRIVKRFIRGHGGAPTVPRGLPVREAGPGCRLRARGRLVRPGTAECVRNPRARSARMRVAERCG